MSIEAAGPPIRCDLAEEKESKLLKRCRWPGGAFELLWAAHRRSVESFIRFHIGPDDQSACQIATEVHDIIERNLDLDKARNGPKGFHKYIRSTAFNKCRHYKRNQARHEPISESGSVRGRGREEEGNRGERVGRVLKAPESDDPQIILMWIETYRLFFCSLFGSPFPPHEVLFFAYVWLLYRIDEYCKPSAFWDDCSGAKLSRLADDFWDRYVEAAQVHTHAPHTAEEMRRSMDAFGTRLGSGAPGGGTVGKTRLADYYESREKALNAWQAIRERISGYVLPRLPW